MYVVLLADYIHKKDPCLLLFPFSSSLLPPHVTVKDAHRRSNVERRWHFPPFFSKCLRKIRNDESPRAQTKENVALVEWELFGPGKKKNDKKRQKVMKHSSRGSVKLNQFSRPRANAGHKKGKRKFGGLWHHQPTGPQRACKYSHITWLISMKRQVVSSPANCLWQVCRGVSEICYDGSGAAIQQRRHALTGPSRRCTWRCGGAAAAPIYTVSAHNKRALPGLGRRYIRINLSLPNIKHRGGVHSIGCEL